MTMSSVLPLLTSAVSDVHVDAFTYAGSLKNKEDTNPKWGSRQAFHAFTICPWRALAKSLSIKAYWKMQVYTAAELQRKVPLLQSFRVTKRRVLGVFASSLTEQDLSL